MQDKIKQLISDIQEGSHKALARAITIVENEIPGYDILLQSLGNNTSSKVVGITGPPGAGKSTLVNTLIEHWVAADKKIAVIAVDPSSPFNYGAILGDRIRMSDFYNNPHVFIRSLASRGALGGLNPKIIEITDVVKAAPFDIILVETVGVGQSEVEIAGLADCTVVTLVPEAGDEVQTLKAGIMEIADLFVVNKADREAADALFISLKAMVHAKAGMGDETPVLKTVATEAKGIREVANSIQSLLAKEEALTDKKLQLLTEKCWMLIQAREMQAYNKKDIAEELKKRVQSPAFNIYNFVKDITD